jgi:hypothetical protein
VRRIRRLAQMKIPRDSAILMRQFLMSARWWAIPSVCLVVGLLTAAAFTLLWPLGFAPRSVEELILRLKEGAVGGVVMGLGIGILVGREITQTNNAERCALAPLPKESHRSALLAAEGGPVPAQLDIRQGAARLASHRLDRATSAAAKRKPYWSFPFVFCLIMAINAMHVSGWYWLAAAIPAACWGYQSWSAPKRQRRRTEHLLHRVELLRANLPREDVQ